MNEFKTVTCVTNKQLPARWFIH